MTLRLRNTLTRQVEPVDPLEPGRVRMYTCGPTVYRYAHVGNLRTFLLADLIRRVLLYHGLEVLHVKNVTDVGHLRDERFDRGEDRMLVAAGLEHKTTAEIAAAYEAAFHADEALLNILPAHAFPRPTEHIAEMIELAERLVDLGYAYVSGLGNVYYAVDRLPEYGRLSGNSLAKLRAGHRGDVEQDKRDPADFALWKHADKGRLLKWDTPRWGEGFPGWHLECTAMSWRYLGTKFDIHTGGVDNVFPHHEDEIAQAIPLTGNVPARLWVHGEHLLMSGQKMAKSSGNILRVTELDEMGIDPLAFRYLALTSHYSHKLIFSERSLASAAAALTSLRTRLAALGPSPSQGPWVAPPVLEAGRAGDRPTGVAAGPRGHQASPGRADDVVLSDRAHEPPVPLSASGAAFHRRFVDALDDNLNLPVALSVVREVLRSDVSPDEKRWLVLDADFVLGLDLHRAVQPDRRGGAPSGEADELEEADLPAEARELVERRTRARAGRDFVLADSLRDELARLGIEVVDRPDGTTTWRTIARA